jgi:outer membrane protein assembly factor BamB
MKLCNRVRKNIIATISIFLTLVSCTSIFHQNSATHQVTVIQGSSVVDWEMRDVTIRSNEQPLLVYVGRNTSVNNESAFLVVGDTLSSAINSPCLSSIAIDNELVYVGNCLSEVSAYNHSGQVWLTTINNEGDISRILISPDGLNVYTETGHVFRLSRSTGEVQEKYSLDCSLAVLTSAIIFDRCNGGLEALDSGSRNKLWEYFLDEPIHGLPIIIDDYLVVRTGLRFGNLFVFDRVQGNLLWHTTTNNIVGNPIKYQGLLYDVTTDGELQGYDLNNGQIQTRLLFAPLVNSDHDKSIENAYFLAADEKRIYVYFGDSLQLFALQISP